MFQEERLVAILQHLQVNKRIEVDEICELLSVSRDTARRDIIKLEERGCIVRTRGGAILPTISKEMPNYEQRLQKETTSKQAIGRLAASLLHDEDYLYVDSSTTVRYVGEYMTTKRNVVVTNSIDMAGMLASKDEARIHLLGGLLYNGQRMVYGARAIEMMSDYHLDKAFLGTCGLSLGGLTTDFEEESYLIRQVIRKADQVIVLADHSKFGKTMFHRVTGLEDIDLIITNREPDEEWKRQLHEVGVELVVADGGERHD
ncbi:DeoR/GlpR family DNA-binding transcription regulator [Paenibacillus profundus]|uniref:DeoR/GlpR family DNA-binding transcription regulator n=1 Tax=Paenibacillus profundus TaxID=1173085 RepID=A0ABS8YIE7_9BACL|nr:DeoR/GlpR family DNA-binding transcription regulator [Paenibacillus profundus]MCE5171014.1 DeoR/GlpR family DNA-binding transcription regulator [Paenibacillus profundus]